MPATTLLLPVPRLGALTGPFRSRWDPAAAADVPPHVTVLHPFLDTTAITPEVLATLGAVAAAHDVLEVAAADVGIFPEGEVLHLRFSPEAPLRALTEDLRAATGVVPYGGRFDEVVPHLTVGHAIPRSTARHAARSLLLSLPVRVRIDALQLWWDGPEGWQHAASFPLREPARV